MLIAGPTASGKSALALRRAQELGGIVVNTDALQVYQGLRLITARPGDADLGAALQELYGTVDPAVRFSTGDWVRAAALVVAEAGERPLIFAGGTGLYFESLIKGFAEVPEVPDEAAEGGRRDLVVDLGHPTGSPAALARPRRLASSRGRRITA